MDTTSPFNSAIPNGRSLVRYNPVGVDSDAADFADLIIEVELTTRARFLRGVEHLEFHLR